MNEHRPSEKRVFWRWLVAWFLFCVGHVLSKVPGTYSAYNRLMNWSAGIQGPSGNGPWGRICDSGLK